jgi:Sulfotransferase family
MKDLIFLLGLPRSGTTLLQRVLAAHPDVASVAEPWVLLPLVTCFDADITRSVYGHKILDKAIADLKAEAGNFQQALDGHIRQFINEIYTPLRDGKKYFLDKTPRYYLIVEELHRLFPEAKFIYLFRNPLDIYDSIIETFYRGNLRALPANILDVTEGMNLLCAPLKNDRENALKINYEDFCANSADVTEKICKFLEIEYRPEMLTEFSQVKFSGSLVDPKHDQSSKIAYVENNRPVSIARRHLYMQWLKRISKLSWSVSGYRHDDLSEQLKSRPAAEIWKQLDDLLAVAVNYRETFWARRNQRRHNGREGKYGCYFF